MKKIILALLVLLLVLAASPLTALATDITVSSFAELQNAINSAIGQTNIIVSQNITLTGMLTIPAGKDITIKSAGANNFTLSIAAAGYRHFTVNANTALSLENITLDGGYDGSSTAYQGGIKNSGDIELNYGAIITKCYADYGGGIYNYAGTIDISGGEISNNSVMGGISERGGGGIFNNGGTITISGGEIRNNTVIGIISELSELCGGGGIFNNGGTVIISCGEISNNTIIGSINEYGGGGGIFNNGGTVIISGGEIIGNTTLGNDGNISYGSGGGINNSNGGIVNIVGGKISGNISNNSGGGIYNTSNLISISSAEINDNIARSSGGGIISSGDLTLYDVIIKGNTASVGGGIHFLWGTISVEGGEISGNSATSSGGGIETNRGTVIINGTEISSNSAYRGGGINSTNFSTVFFNYGKIIDNNASNGGGFYTLDSNININSGEISGNITRYNGGGIYISNSYRNTYSAVTINGGEISGNSAVSGGGIYCDYGTVIVKGGKINDNNAYNGGGIYGCSIYNLGFASFTIENGEISGNTATFGGGIYNDSESSLTISGGEISGNMADTFGGGIYNNRESSLTISGGEINCNTATYGGGIYNYNTVIVSGGKINGNIAHRGGGLFNTGEKNRECTVNVSGGEISGNIANTFGGGIYNYSTVNITGGTINSNIANGSGGGIFNDHIVDVSDGLININGGKINDNTATASGGGLTNRDYCTLIVYGGEISGNTAYSGGGILNVGDLRLYGTKISYNTARNNGGGIYNDGGIYYGSGIVYVNGGEIRGNSANLDGGGIWTADLSDVTVSNAVFNGNTAKQAYWITDVADIDTHNTQITDVASFSAPPTSHKPFEYAYNNYDINYTKGLTENPLWDGIARTFDELQEAITNASGPTNIIIGADIKYPSMLTIPSGKDITIKSMVDNNYTLSLADYSRHFTVCENAALTLENITLDGGYGGSGYDYRGGIYNGGDLTLCDGTVITKCYSDYGGGIYNFGNGSIIVSGGEINGNYANEGGGICNYSTGTIVVCGGEISGNTAVSYGGGICSHGEVTVSSGVIRDNTAYSGGGLYNYSDSTVNVSNGEIRGNTARWGGGISSYGTVNIEGGKISNNTANYGGGINIANGTVNVINGEISSNTADTGGGIDNSMGTLIIIGGIISSNNADYGSGIFNSNLVDISGGKISDNIAINDGGGIYNNLGGTINVVDGEITCNIAKRGGGICNTAWLIVVGGKISDNRANTDGGGIYNARLVDISGGEISGNVANKNGGGIYNAGLADISGGEINGNKANANGGGIYNWDTGVISSGKISGNEAIINGGGIYNEEELDITGGEISYNTAHINGGGIWTENLTAVTVSNAIFSGNTAAQAYWITDSADIATHNAQITEVTGFSAPPAGNKPFEYAYNNYDINYTKGLTENPLDMVVRTFAELQDAIDNASGPTNIYIGADIAFPSQITVLSAKDIVIKSTEGDNYTFSVVAAGYRHFAVAANAALALENITLNGGYNGSGNDIRGGIENNGKLTLSSGAIITKCYAGSGGGIYNYAGGTITISGGEINGNHAADGGGIYNYGTGAVIISGGAISGNSAVWNGGGIFNSPGSRTSIDGGAISGNVTGWFGGGIYNANGSTVNIDGGAISGNTAGSGGGVYNYTYGSLNLAGGAISGNTASSGAGIYNDSAGIVTVKSGKISDNSARTNGGGIYNDFGTVSISDGEINENTANINGGGIYTFNLTTVTVSNATFNGNTASQAYWMTDPADIATYNAQITEVTGFSAPPAGNMPFEYAYNNYDISYTKGLTENTILLGDINEDGRINLSDLSFLAQYFIGGYRILEIFPRIHITGDMNRNGELELDDLDLLVYLIVNSRFNNLEFKIENVELEEPRAATTAAFDMATPTEDKVTMITVPALEGKPGERVVIPVVIENSPGVKMYQLAMQYDNTKLEFISQSSGPTFAHPASLRNGGPIQVDGDIWEARVTYLGELLAPQTVPGDVILCEFEFEIRDGAAGGETQLTLKPQNSYILSGSGNNVYPEIANGAITIEATEETESYNFRAYMEAAQTNLKAGDTLNVDIMLTGDLNYTQLNTAIAYNANLLEFAGYANLGGLVAEVKKDGADKINVRSVASLNMLTGAACTTPVRVVTLKFTVKDTLAAESINTDLSFASIAVTPAAGVTGATTAPGKSLSIILNR